ncbi:type II toxin-antitoxin system VapC family toxin [Halopiger goleimassiliensis]|uniref:type II toxin-antitoxin system VapC family toxin n=1 Tax=Halopiger goleimassiliensis TaxID=1293048 RepID=UPI002282F8EB
MYYLDRTLEEHDAVARSVRSILEEKPLFTATVFQIEVVHYLHTQLSNPEEPIDRFLAFEGVSVADLTPVDVDRAVTLLEDHPTAGIGGRDATVIAAMRRYDVSRSWTYDGGLKRLGDELSWLEVTDPVEASPEST